MGKFSRRSVKLRMVILGAAAADQSALRGWNDFPALYVFRVMVSKDLAGLPCVSEREIESKA